MNEGKGRVYLYLLLTFSIWGSLYVASKYVLGHLQPMTVSFLRYLIAVVALGPLILRVPWRPIARGDSRHFLFVGACGYGLSMAAQMLGTRYAGASLASLVNALNPVAIILVAALILKERLTRHRILGLLLALVGTYIILGAAQEPGHAAGILLSLLSVLIWAFVSVDLRRLTRRYPPLQITFLCMVIGMGFTLPFTLWELHGAPLPQVPRGTWLAMLYMGLVCTALAHLLWSKCLSRLEAGTCSLFYPIQPLVSTGLGALWLRERFHTSFFVGGFLILVGVVVSLAEKPAVRIRSQEPAPGPASEALD